VSNINILDESGKMEFRVGSQEELQFVNKIIEKQINRTKENKIKNGLKIIDIKEYRYLQYLVFKYCFIPNAAL
jgi:hypothetical protein